MFTELSLGCWSLGHRNLYMYQFFMFSFVNYVLTFIMYCSRLFVVFQEMHTFEHDVHRSQNFISLPSFIFVNAAVSEIRELNRNKKEKKNHQFKNFPGHIIYLFLSRGTF